MRVIKLVFVLKILSVRRMFLRDMSVLILESKVLLWVVGIFIGMILIVSGLIL